MTQLERNKQLLDSIQTDTIDLAEIAKILQSGADPLGFFCEDNSEDTVLTCLFDSDLEQLPEIVKLFLDYGMNIGIYNAEMRENQQDNPMWDFAFCCGEPALRTLKIFLDYGLDVDSAEILANHILTDTAFASDCYEPQEELDEIGSNGLKMVMMLAASDRILSASEYLQKCLEVDKNTYDLHKFADWNAFSYVLDNSTKPNDGTFWGSTVKIYEKASNSLVWHFSL